jgi:hemolysin activation/secretion protein
MVWGKISKLELRRRCEAIGLVALSGWALTTSFEALAQNQASPTQPSLPTREEVEGLRGEAPARAQQVSVDSRRAVEQGPCPLLESDVMVDISTIRFEGQADQPIPPEFMPLLSRVKPNVLGQQRIAAVCDMRDQANAVLRAAGYVAGVQIPAQEITNGELRLQVIAGRITDVSVSGDPRHYRESVSARIEQLKALYPLNQKDAERILLIAGDVPGLDVSLALRSANAKPGELIGELNIDTVSGTLLANIQNTGSRQLGRELATLRGEIYGITGAADITYISASNSLQFKEQHVLQAGHEMGIGKSGLRFGLRGSYAISNPDILNLSLKTRSIITGIDLKMPLVRQVTQSVSGGIGLEYAHQRTQIGGANGRFPFTQDRTTFAYAKFDAAFRSPRSDGDNDWMIDGTIEARKGLDILKATPRRTFVNGFSPSRFDGDSQATVIRGDVAGSLRLGRGVWLTGSAYGQWSNRALLNLEEFSIGNLTYGRGYNPGANGGDRVVAFRIEPRARIVDSAKWRLEISGFYDNVRLWNKDASTIETRRTLDSIGGGARIVFDRRVILDLTYAKPLKFALATDQRRPPSRILFSLTTKLLPWK